MKEHRRDIPQLRNALIIVLQLCAIAGCYWLLRSVSSPWELIGLAIAFGIVMNSVYSIIHEAHHAVLFRNRRVNDFFGIVMSLFFPAAFHLLRQGHLGHHVRNRSDDEVFDLYFDRRDRVWKTIVWYGILTGLYWGLVVVSNFAALLAPVLLSSGKYRWHRTFEAFLESFNPRYLTLIRVESAAAIALHTLIVLSLGVSLWSYLAMYYGFGLMWSSMQYIHHYAAERDVLLGARNLYISAVLDKIWLHHNLHRTHHRNPSLPWCYLPQRALEQQETVDFLPRYYTAMWKGPRLTEEHVKNRYAGRIIG